MKKKNRHLIGNVGILALSNFSSKILSFLLVPLYTSILSTEEYGIYDLIIVTAELLIPIITLNIFDALMRFLLNTEKDDKEVISIGVKYTCIAITIVTIGIVIFSQLSYFAKYKNMSILIWFYFTFNILHQFCVQYAKGNDNVKDLGISGVVSTALNLTGNIIFLLYFNMRLTGFFLANVIALGTSTIYLIVRMRVWECVRTYTYSKNLESEMLKYCRPLIFTAVAWWANSSLDKYVVAAICGVAANGLISVAYKIPSFVNMFQSIFIQAWQISAIKEHSSKDKNSFYRTTYIIFNFLLCSIGFLLIISSKYVASIIFAKDFFKAWIYIPFLVIAFIINSASGFLGPILSAEYKTKAMANSAYVGLASNLILNVVLVYFIGIQGATIATVISSLLIYIVRKSSVSNFMSKKEHFYVILQWVLLCVQSIVKIYGGSIIYEIVVGIFMLVLNISIIIKMYLFIKNIVYKMISKVKDIKKNKI